MYARVSAPPLPYPSLAYLGVVEHEQGVGQLLGDRLVGLVDRGRRAVRGPPRCGAGGVALQDDALVLGLVGVGVWGVGVGVVRWGEDRMGWGGVRSMHPFWFGVGSGDFEGEGMLVYFGVSGAGWHGMWM